MKNKALLLGLSIFMFSLSQAGTALPGAEKKPVIAFTENKGQVHDQNYQPRTDVLYGAMTGNMAVHIKKTGVSYQLYRVDKDKEVVDERTKESRKEIEKQTIHRVDLNWINYNTNFTISPDEVLPGYNNYYLESCPDGVVYVKSYKGVTLHNLYDGIDLHYYEKNGELKHDYIVKPQSDYRQIKVEIEGAEINLNEDGSLLLITPLGKIQEGAPIVYQNGKQLAAKWKLENNVLSFEIENCDPKYELIVDPVTRLWGTYYGGSDEDISRASTKDASNNVYVTGGTFSGTGTIIATAGSHQSSYGGFYDAFLTKFNSNGVRQWGTYYGNSGIQRGFSCATDVSGNVYMSGETSSASGTVIVTVGSHQTSYGGGTVDALLVKFNSNGIRQWSTYYGGSNNEGGSSCATDINGNVYMMGSTNSSNGSSIATPGSHQSVAGGAGDAFLVKFNSNGVRQWGTYYGGTGQETGFSCSTNTAGDIYIAGSTIQGTNGIASPGSHQTVYGGGTFDGFLAKFNSNGVLQWGTYYGDTGDDESFSCATDASGNIYMSGSTSSNTGTAIATVGSHQQTTGAGLRDAFLVKFDANGIRQWGTYYGGSGEDRAFACTTDAGGNVFLSGYTDSNTGTTIATAASHQSTYGGGTFDGFIAKFDNNGNRQWGTYYGGAGEDRAYSCVTNNGSLYLAGYTDSNSVTAIATPGSHQATYGGGVYDAFLAKFDVCETAPVQPSSINGAASLCSGSASTYSITNVSGATSYTWSLPAGWSGSSNTNSISATPGTSGVFSVAAGNACGASAQQTLSVTVNPLPTITASSSSSILCEGESATLTASGASTYTFNPGGTGASIVVAPSVTSVYTVSGTDANGCSNTFIFTQNVDACVGINSNGLIAPSLVEMYPNPTEGKINLELRSNSEVTIINSLGQVIYETNVSSGKHELELEHLAKGLYVVKVKSGKDIVTIKVIKD